MSVWNYGYLSSQPAVNRPDKLKSYFNIDCKAKRTAIQQYIETHVKR